MLVKARWNVKDETGWHMAGDVFQTEENLGDAVEVLEKPAEKKQEKPVTEEPEKVEEKPAAEPEKPKTTRRKKTSE